MSQPPKKSSRSIQVVAVIIILVIIIVGIYAAWTYPRAVLGLPISLSIGLTASSGQFEVPFLDNKVDVQVTINSGTAIWTARITRDGQAPWNYTATQGGQTTYDSGWMTLSSGSYNLTFTIVGGALSGEVTVSAKGGFW